MYKINTVSPAVMSGSKFQTFFEFYRGHDGGTYDIYSIFKYLFIIY